MAGITRRAHAMRRNVVRTILASALALAGSRAGAQRALATPPGSGRAPLFRANTLPLAHDLASDARDAERERKPLLLYFDREECPYCERALREYLVPLSRDEWKARAEAAKAALATVPVKAIATATRAATAVYGLSETRKDVQAINRWLLEREQEKIQKARQAVQP